ncbi:carbohydrate kinase family protein [Metabacillus bambusae]|uniref:Carbohydrate kinase n=1 Tax=Metabacillus bambusae TaxID=2795218 RepID=A0ABS3N616_9BACI|nr:carbohydrate kinase [Metabacillus bambusae]MBO1513489.1 carbohydrate kinase [Metabacillus bambusae]
MRSSIICIGELLIDFFCTDVDIDSINGRNFEKQAGGAPANVCATIAKLGGHAVFSGKVGNDSFGHFLKKALDEISVDTSMLMFDEDHLTTLAFVSLQANGERDFVFNRGADAFLSESEIDKDKVKQAKILHFGSATALLEDPFQSTYINTMLFANGEKKFISFDPNYRKDLWKGNTSKFTELAKEAIALADFVKVSDDELKIISGKKDVVEGLNKLHKFGAGVIAVTLGKAGTLISNGVEHDIVPSFNVQSIDSTGAGDAFVGATLFQLAKVGDPQNIGNNFEHLKKIISFSNKVGAIVCTKVGAISAIPSFDKSYSDQVRPINSLHFS